MQSEFGFGVPFKKEKKEKEGYLGGTSLGGEGITRKKMLTDCM